MDHFQTCRSLPRRFNAKLVTQWCEQKKTVARFGRNQVKQCERRRAAGLVLTRGHGCMAHDFNEETHYDFP